MFSQVIIQAGFVLLCLSGGSSDINGDGCVDLRDVAIIQNTLTGPSCAGGGTDFVPTVSVPGGGAGPAYDFSMGKFEITNGQFADFLNSAQADGGATRRGSFMLFYPSGHVTTLDLYEMFTPRFDGFIQYDSAGLIGSRYSVRSGFADMPVVETTWYGAAKYCNWLTMQYGLGEEELCFAEGFEHEDWRPITISKASWQSRNLNDVERQLLVDHCRGFRLPMINGSIVSYPSGGVKVESNPYGEWYKAAAYDQRAPDYHRPGFAGEWVAPDHWIFGVGRDTISPFDGNYYESGDPFEGGPTPVGYFNGETWIVNPSALTLPNNNNYGVFDASGNVYELMLDRGGYDCAIVVGGAWATILPGGLGVGANGFCVFRALSQNHIGFRVMRVP